MSTVNTRKLVESAILIALGTVLSMFKIIDFPWGGGVTIFAMLPLILISYRYGVKWGLACGFVFGIIQLFIGIGTNVFGGLSPLSMIIMLMLDYVIAYTVVGLGGIFSGKFKSAMAALVLGTLLAVFCRYAAHMISGVIFFGSYAEWFFSGGESGFSAEVGSFFLSNFNGMGLSVIYSAVLNGMTMVAEMAVTTVGAIIVSKVPTLNKRIVATTNTKTQTV